MARATTDKTVVFVGYSGSDPDLRSLIRDLPAHQIIWVCRSIPGWGVSDYIRNCARTDLCFATTDLKRFLVQCGRSLGITPPDLLAPPSREWRIDEFWKRVSVHQRIWSLALLHAYAGQFEDADRCFAWMLPRLKRDGMASMRRASLYSRRGDVAFRAREFKRATVFWSRQKRYSEDLSERVFYLDALCNLSAVFYQQCRWKQSLETLQIGLQITRRLRRTEFPSKLKNITGNLWQNYGLVLSATGKPTKALVAFRHAFKSYRSAGDLVMASMCQIDQAVPLAQVRGLIDRDALESHLRIIQDYGRREQLGVAAVGVGRALWAAGHPSEATAQLEDALHISKTNGDVLAMANALSLLLSVGWHLPEVSSYLRSFSPARLSARDS